MLHRGAKFYVHLCNNISSFETEHRLVKVLELKSNDSHIITNAPRICQCCQPIYNAQICVLMKDEDDDETEVNENLASVP